MTTTEHYDAVIVGARAAGAGTAMLLAREGRRVLVLDRATRGSDTVSTHALMKAGVLQLQRWGLLDRIRAAGTPALRHTVVHYDDGAIDIPVQDDGGIDALYAPRRTVLDPILATAAEEAGAEVRFETPVKGVLHGANRRVTGVAYQAPDGRTVEARAPMTIGADGARSLVARAVDAPIVHRGRHASAVAYAYFDTTGFDGFQWFFRHGGGAGAIPTNDGSLVYVAVPADRYATELRPDVEAGFWRLLHLLAPEVATILSPTARTSRFHVFSGAPGFHRRCAGPGWALVGDASHFKDPISAHGLTDALRDAELLARALAPTLDDPGAASLALAAYEIERDRLSRPMFDLADQVASGVWTSGEVMTMLKELSRHMAVEVDAIRALTPLPTTRAA